jgi:hypothetical protein
MGRIVKGSLLIMFGFLMLAWFAYSVVNPPRRPSETYTMDWVLVFIRLIAGMAALIGGALAFRSK